MSGSPELDKDLFDQLREKTGLALSDAELLQHYRLAEPRNGRVVLSLAAILLFAKDPLRWHPACHIDFVKWEGTERRFGAELNVVKRVRIEAPLLRLIEQTFQTIWPHIRERQRLVDLFFGWLMLTAMPGDLQAGPIKSLSMWGFMPHRKTSRT